jgi:hypothetical protein
MDVVEVLSFYLIMLGLLVLGHQSDDRRILELVIIEDGAVLDFVDLVRTKETMLILISIIRRCKVANGLFKIAIVRYHGNDGVCVSIVWMIVSGIEVGRASVS